MKKFIQEFKAFALRGNVMDMAVGVMIGRRLFGHRHFPHRQFHHTGHQPADRRRPGTACRTRQPSAPALRPPSSIS